MAITPKERHKHNLLYGMKSTKLNIVVDKRSFVCHTRKSK